MRQHLREGGLVDKILEQLPDERATQRLLAALDKLESSLAAQRKGSRQAAEASAELAALRDENLRLKFKQTKARERLDKLLAKLPGLFPELSDQNQEAA